MARAESVRSLFAYLHASPSPYHAVANAVARLEEAGFTPSRRARAVGRRHRRPLRGRGGALVAWRSPAGATPTAGSGSWAPTPTPPTCGSSPTPTPATSGWRQLAVEVYGGAARELLARPRPGPVRAGWSLRDGEVVLVLRRPSRWPRVPQLAIHLDRDVNERGLLLDKQVHLTPVWGLGPPAEGALVELVAAAAGLDAGRHRRPGT